MIVVGGSSLGRSAIQIAKAQASYTVVGVLDDVHPNEATIEGLPYLGTIDQLAERQASISDLGAVIAVGDPRSRRAIMRRLRIASPSLPFLTIVHPNATYLGTSKIGAGCILFPGCVVGPGAEIGNLAVLNANVTIGAGARIGDLCSIAPGANIGSEAVLDTGVYVGMGAAVAQQVRLESWSTLEPDSKVHEA